MITATNVLIVLMGIRDFHFSSWKWILLLFLAITRSVSNVFLNLSTDNLKIRGPYLAYSDK